MEKEIKIKFDNAVKLKESGNYEESKSILQELHNEQNDNAAILAVLGDVLWDMNELDEASKYFRKGVELKPDSEALSQGLFHTLWESDKDLEALLEIKRFMENNFLQDYKDTIEDLKQSEYYSPLLTKISLD